MVWKYLEKILAGAGVVMALAALPLMSNVIGQLLIVLSVEIALLLVMFQKRYIPTEQPEPTMITPIVREAYNAVQQMQKARLQPKMEFQDIDEPEERMIPTTQEDEEIEVQPDIDRRQPYKPNPKSKPEPQPEQRPIPAIREHKATPQGDYFKIENNVPTCKLCGTPMKNNSKVTWARHLAMKHPKELQAALDL